jgi:GTP1/Obg family GTP-binding protein
MGFYVYILDNSARCVMQRQQQLSLRVRVAATPMQQARGS